MNKRLAIIHLERSDPLVLHLLNNYRRKFGLSPGGVGDDGSQWWGLLDGGDITVVFADRRFDGCIFIDNLCPAEGFAGKRGVYTILTMYRNAVDAGLVRAIACNVLCENEAQRRALKRIFKQIPVPVAEVFMYGGAKK